MRAAERYVLRVLADQWAGPARMPSLLDIRRADDALAAELRAIGFQVTGLTLQDGSLEYLSERLAGVTDTFDAICCRDVLELVDDWTEVVGRIARRLRPGGVFLYTVGCATPARTRLLPGFVREWLGLDSAPDTRLRRGTITALDMTATLRRIGLLPREMRAFGQDVARAAGPGWAAYAGYSVRRVDRLAPATGMRWDFSGTGERWITDRR
jgi:SAM-dependent methyltransferase